MATQTKSKKAAQKPGSSKKTYLRMIQEAIKAGDEKKGVSRSAIKKFITDKYHVDFNQKKHVNQLNRIIKKALAENTLKNGRTSGVFKLGDAKPKARKPRAKKASKPKAAKRTREAKPKSVKRGAAPSKAKAAKKPANEQ